MKTLKCSLWHNPKHIDTVVQAADYTQAKALVYAMFPGCKMSCLKPVH